ncbi:protein BTG2-like [Littorina saxatilis]
MCIPVAMKEEVDSATGFLTGLISRKVTSKFAECFRAEISRLMALRYRDHWHPQKPNRGSAFRSIAIHYDRIDPLVLEALIQVSGCEKKAKIIGKHFPQELTLWVDPKDVSYRIGDNGSIGVVYAGPSLTVSSDSESDSDASMNSSPSTSPCSSPVGSPPRPAHLEYLQQPAHPFARQCRQQAFHQSPYLHYNDLMVYS